MSFATEPRDGNTIPVRIYRPANAVSQCPIIYIHGGCWVFCDLDSHDPICRHLASRSQCPVVSIGYRLAPEHPFPAGLHDCIDACTHLHQHAHTYNLDPSAFVIAGDSAGGNLAAIIAQLNNNNQDEFCLRRLRGTRPPKYPHNERVDSACVAPSDTGRSDAHIWESRGTRPFGRRRQNHVMLPIVGQILIYPITDVSSRDYESVRLYGEGYFLGEELLGWTRDLYLEGAAGGKSRSVDLRDPLVSPLLAENLAGLPPALVITAEFDPLRDEGEAYAERLAAAGVSTECIRYNGVIHAFVAMAGAVKPGSHALDQCAAFAKKSLTPKGATP